MENQSMIGVHTGTQHLRMLVFLNHKSKVFILTASILVVSAARVQAKDWHGIVPLRSTRADVERLLGKPSTDRTRTIFYEIDTDTVSFDFAGDVCRGSDDWNVPQNTVVAIWVMHRGRKLKFEDLKLDVKRFNRIQDKETLNIYHYTDEEEGVRYEVDESDGTVTLIHYFPAKKDQHLRCRCDSNKGTQASASKRS